MIQPCELNQQESTPTLCRRVRSPVATLPRLLGQTFGELMAFLAAKGEKPAGMPYVGYRNMDLSDLDLEIGFPVSHPLAGDGTILAGEIPAGTVATTLFVGPYDGVAAAHDALQAFVKARGRRAAGVAYEFYYDGPETPPEKTRTRLVVPLLPA